MICNKTLAKNYYTAMSRKNVADLEKVVHPDIRFKGPLAEFTGKETYLTVVQNFTSVFKELIIHSVMAEGDQAVVIYEVHMPEPVGLLSAAAVLKFKDGLVTDIELIYDGGKADTKKEEIFN